MLLRQFKPGQTSVTEVHMLNNTYLYSFIVIKAEHVSHDNIGGTSYLFPDDGDDLTNYTGGSAQVIVPNGLLQAIGKCI